MDAFFRGFLLIGALSSLGAGFRTPNFIIQAPTAEFAQQVGEAAEVYRRELAIEWLGAPLPGNWKNPCPITVVPGNMGAGGKTTFNFHGGEVYGWKMEVKGSEQRILDSVLPHEINHTIFASYFRRPLPRWADEGAASLIEHESERNQLRHIHSRVMGTSRRIPLKTLLDIKQYPQEQQEILTLYAEGHSLADFLIQRRGKPEYIRLMSTAYEQDWETALKTIYGVKSLSALESEWDSWVMAGSPSLNIPKGSQLASRDKASDNEPKIRAQSPEGDSKSAEPARVIAAEVPLNRELREVADSSGQRSRSGLQQPVYTINKQTTDAAKVIKE